MANETGFPRVSYVGQAANLADRFCEHVFWTLGGAYCLYTDDHILRGDTPTPEYHPSMANLLTDFLEEDRRGSVPARRNLFAYRFWWATVPAERIPREAVESALITEARSRREPHASPRLRIRSVFGPGARVEGVGVEIEYGELDESV